MINPQERIIKFREKTIKIENINIFTKDKTIFNSFAGDQEYKGDFYITNVDDKLKIINEVLIDDYFASVLGSEMGGEFSMESLKASAIAIRTYFYKKKRNYINYDYDINNADGIDMVYRGSFYATKKMYQAFKETENLFLVDNNDNLVLPLFHSTSGGIILKDIVMKSGFNDNIDNPVLLYDVDEKNIPLSIKSPYFKFNTVLTSENLKNILSTKIKTSVIQNIKLKYFSNTKCVDFIGFENNSSKIFWLKGFEFISLAQKKGFYNLRSIQFRVDKINDNYYFIGSGFGHLCGMSQYSAEKLARNGYNFTFILKKYYPNYEIKRFLFHF
jgi:stage II sporulation protein D